MKTEIMEKIEWRINGGINPRLTKSDFELLDFDAKKDVVWGLQCSLEYASNFHGVDREVFQKVRRLVDQHADITIDNVDDLYDLMVVETKIHTKNMLKATYDYHNSLGRKIQQQQKELGFSGFLEMSPGKLCGYIEEYGSWNNFDPVLVGDVIMELEGSVPTKDYGINNPNTGAPFHKWKINSDYLIMSFGYVSEKDLERIESYYLKQWGVLGRKAKADSIRIEKNSLGNWFGNGEYFDVELVMWWD